MLYPDAALDRLATALALVRDDGRPVWLVRLFDALPLLIWLQALTATPLIGPLFDQVWLAYAMSWGGLLFDCTIPLWLSWRKTRLLAYSAVILFHGLTGLLFNIGMFPWIMIVCTLVFFEWQLPQNAKMGISAENPPPARWLPWLLGAFLLVQLLLPLRHWLYPGDVNWTEEGFRFAWRVMLVEKTGHATFFVRDPASGREWTVFPSEYLTPLQESEMVSQPDMLLQFAHFLQDEFGSNMQVHAEAYVSWNGRDSHLLVDPCIDLAAQPNTLAASLQPRAWIVREPTLRQKACAH